MLEAVDFLFLKLAKLAHSTGGFIGTLSCSHVLELDAHAIALYTLAR